MLNKFSIRLRLVVAFAVMVVLIVIIGSVSRQSNDDMAMLTTRLFRHPFTVTNSLADANAHIIDMRSVMKDVVLAETSAEIDAAVDRIQVLDASVRGLFDLVMERFLGDKKMVQEAVSAYEGWGPIRAEVIRLSRLGQKVEAQKVVKGDAARQVQVLREKMDAVRNWARGRAIKFMENAEATRADVQGSMLWLLGLTVFFAVACAWLITRSITGPIARLKKAMGQIRSGQTDMAIPGCAYADEIGVLARGLDELRKTVEDAFRLNQMVEEQPAAVMLCTPDLKISYANQAAKKILQGMEPHGKRWSSSDVVGRSVLEFHRAPDRVRAILTDMSKLPYFGKFNMGGVTIENTVNAIRDKQGRVVGTMLSWKDVTEYVKLAEAFERDVRGVAQSVAAACAKLKGVSQTMTQVAGSARNESASVLSAAERAAGNVETVAAAAEELSASISEISRQVAASAAMARGTAKEANQANATLASLSEAAHKIGEVVGLINNIASQTNLLALNATIEAARAGEAGKGFAVVAGEVKNLASQTAKATDDIQAQVAQMQGVTELSVKAIQRIIGVIGDIDSNAATIAAAVEEQGSATMEISRNVQAASSGTQQVTTGIGNVARAIDETGQCAGDVLASVEKLSQESQILEREIEKFLSKMVRS
ncbi:methyl-accepting chemotaxis protein [Azospirillaceae bacterium]